MGDIVTDGRLEVDHERVLGLASAFADHARTVGTISGHDCDDEIATGLPDSAVGAACTQVAGSAGEVLTALGVRFGRLHARTHYGVGTYADAEVTSADGFTAAGESA